LSPEDTVRFDDHLLTCPPCTDYLAQMRVTIALAGELDRAAVKKQVEAKLIDLFRRWHQKT
jgi:hypothetical protein